MSVLQFHCSLQVASCALRNLIRTLVNSIIFELYEYPCIFPSLYKITVPQVYAFASPPIFSYIIFTPKLVPLMRTFLNTVTILMQFTIFYSDSLHSKTSDKGSRLCNPITWHDPSLCNSTFRVYVTFEFVFEEVTIT